MANPIPDNYPRLTPALCVDGASDAIEFYTNVLDATERMRLEDGGKVGHAELEFGDSLVMISDEYPEIGVVPQDLGRHRRVTERICRGCGRHVRGSAKGGGDRVAPGFRAVLRRPGRAVSRPLGPPLGSGHSYRRC